MKITTKLLQEHKACKNQIKLFEQWLGKRSFCLLTTANLKSAHKTGLDVRWIFTYLLKTPCDATRKAACGDPGWAYYYAKYVDKTPCDATRKAACGNPELAYWYAYYVDKASHKDTRKAACGNPELAYFYAVYVDKTYLQRY